MRNRNSETVCIPRICIYTIWKKLQGIENLINKAKKSWFMLQQFLHNSEGKTVNRLSTYLCNHKNSCTLSCEDWERAQRPK